MQDWVAPVLEENGGGVAEENPVPLGWEKRRDANGQIYYVDNNARSTQLERLTV